jgi:glutamate-1-semialdehyde aminotransferase
MPNTISMNPSDPIITESDALYARALKLIPAQTQTLAKGAGQYVKGVAPKFLERGKGATVWDVDGNAYVDLNMAIGPLVLGYGHPAVDQAIRDQLEKGITFSLVHPLEVEVAERVNRVVPGAESVRFSKTGCDVTTAAVRLARAFTGRNKVLCCGYHGWHDWYIGVTDRNLGIPQVTQDLTYTFNYNDVQSVVDAIDDDVAAVILEPVVFEEPRNDFLRELRRVTERAGALLVFDEMWTGFRCALGGAQQRYDVRADLACFSKAVANGMPLSVLTGRRDVMQLLEKQVFFFTTFGGEALSLAAAKATIDVLERERVPEQLAAQGKKLKDGYNALAREAGVDGFTRSFGLDCRTIVTFDASAGNPLELKSFVQQEMIRRGVLWSGFHNMSQAHGDAEVAHVLAAYREVLPLLARAVAEGNVGAKLRGAPVEPVFRKTSNFNTKPKQAKAGGAA